MKRILKTLFRVARPLLLVAGFYFGALWLGAKLPRTLVVNVSPWQAGVRQDNFGGGLEAVDLPAGSHFELPGLSAIERVDMRGRLTSFGGEEPRDPNARKYRRAALDIRTVEGQTAQVDVTAAWHIVPGSANRLVEGAMLTSLAAKVADKLESSLRLRLAALASEEWFDARGRMALTSVLEVELGAELAPLFVELDGLYIQGVRFSTDFEKKLQEKQVSHQLALLHEAKGRVESAQAEVDKLAGETAAEVAQLLAEWEQARESAKVAFNLEKAELHAGTELYVKGLHAAVEAEFEASVAAGEAAIEEAKNESALLRLDALSSEGGRVWLAAPAAENHALPEVWLD
jgi:hypothetical protein